jgi:hypothetical protein
MVAAPIFLVIQQYSRALICGGVFAVTSMILKFTWYDNPEPAEKPAKATEILPGPLAFSAFRQWQGSRAERVGDKSVTAGIHQATYGYPHSLGEIIA